MPIIEIIKLIDASDTDDIRKYLDSTWNVDFNKHNLLEISSHPHTSMMLNQISQQEENNIPIHLLAKMSFADDLMSLELALNVAFEFNRYHIFQCLNQPIREKCSEYLAIILMNFLNSDQSNLHHLKRLIDLIVNKHLIRKAFCLEINKHIFENELFATDKYDLFKIILPYYDVATLTNVLITADAYKFYKIVIDQNNFDDSRIFESFAKAKSGCAVVINKYMTHKYGVGFIKVDINDKTPRRVISLADYYDGLRR
jgi:hypothetical protein